MPDSKSIPFTSPYWLNSRLLVRKDVTPATFWKMWGHRMLHAWLPKWTSHLARDFLPQQRGRPDHLSRAVPAAAHALSWPAVLFRKCVLTQSELATAACLPAARPSAALRTDCAPVVQVAALQLFKTTFWPSPLWLLAGLSIFSSPTLFLKCGIIFHTLHLSYSPYSAQIAIFPVKSNIPNSENCWAVSQSVKKHDKFFFAKFYI